MKALQIKLALLLLLFTGIANAQIVNIPDANFKAKLIQLGIDTNGDGEIQFSESMSITELHIQNSSISSLIGIEAFGSLQILSCFQNQLTAIDVSQNQNLFLLDFSDNLVQSVDVSQNDNLQLLNCSGNPIMTLDISQNSNLNSLECSSCSLSLLDVSNNMNLQFLSCGANGLTSLDISQNINLNQLDCSVNQLSVLDVSNNFNLLNLRCFSNELTSLDISNNVNLQFLDCSTNNMFSLNLTNNVNLEGIFCSSNNLASLDVTHNLNLSVLECLDNNLTSLDVTHNANLQALICSVNQLTSLDLIYNLNLSLLECSFNQLTSLDVSNNLILNSLFCSSNQLTSLFIKNGKSENQLSFSSNPNLFYICADEAQVSSVQAQALSFVVVNSYCSFTPGGNYNTIAGNIKFDSNNNGCDINDSAKPNIRVNINDGTNTGASFTSNTGNYVFFTLAGSFIVSPEVENPTWFTFLPTTATIPFADNNNNIATQDFCIAANGVHPDLEVVLAPIAPARPGFDATYKLVYKNKGNQTLSGSVNLVFDDAKTDFISANPIVDNLAVNSLTWNYYNLLPFESRSIDIVLNVNSPQEMPAVNIGDVLNFVATINPISGDELPDDNTFVYNQTVVGSYDPNDITCLEGNNVAPSEIGEYLHYAINFENTGNYPAENVVVKTIVDTTKFDVNSLQLLNTSNPVDARITGNVVEFIFENIQLGGPGGHGHILLKIKSKNTLVAGDAVAKNANIYFDYNAPVDTGMATTVFQSLSNTVFEKDDSINVSPNPTNSKVNINCNNNVKKVELYDVQGRVLETQIGETKTIDISEKANGIYFLKITTEKGSKVEKVVKK